MRIIIDGRLIEVAQTKGLGRYITAVIGGLQQVDDDCDFIVVVPPGTASAVPPHPRWQTVQAPWKWYSWGEQLRFPRFLRSLRPDLVHFPHFNVPLLYGGPFVVTIHDLLLRQWPSDRGGRWQRLVYGLKRLMYRLTVWSAVHRAMAIIVPSAFSAREIKRQYPSAKTPIIVAPYAAGITPKTGEKSNDKTAILRYTNDRPFCLYVGNFYPHKNIGQLIDVFAEISRHWPGDLLLVGRPDDFTAHWQTYAAIHDLDGRARFIGHVSDVDLPALYEAATCFVTLSRYEGFGLPVLEALACGTAVLASDHPSFVEVAGDVITTVPLNHPELIVERWLNLLTNPPSSTAGQRQNHAAQYSWIKTAATHRDCYHAIFSQTKTRDDPAHHTQNHFDQGLGHQTDSVEAGRSHSD